MPIDQALRESWATASSCSTRRTANKKTREGLIALISAADHNRCGRHVRWLNSIEVHRY
jgi:hypothetical protein